MDPSSESVFPSDQTSQSCSTSSTLSSDVSSFLSSNQPLSRPSITSVEVASSSSSSSPPDSSLIITRSSPSSSHSSLVSPSSSSIPCASSSSSSSSSSHSCVLSSSSLPLIPSATSSPSLRVPTSPSSTSPSFSVINPSIYGRPQRRGFLDLVIAAEFYRHYFILFDDKLLFFQGKRGCIKGEIDLEGAHYDVGKLENTISLTTKNKRKFVLRCTNAGEHRAWLRAMSRVSALLQFNHFWVFEEPEDKKEHVVHVAGGQFLDAKGRRLQLRGVNLGGNCKMPLTPNGETHLFTNANDFYSSHTNISFVGRPFPLAEAKEHFTRLRAWGYTTIRFCVTWEAIEHSGPGIYDEEYLDYVYDVLAVANQFGIRAFIDPHQDVWSRFTGGDGAPGWVFEKVGFDLRNFQATGAAYLHQLHDDPSKFPLMLWPTNYLKLACATMFTLFWSGDEFAPLLKIEGKSAQQYLQEHYTAAITRLVKKLTPLSNVIGFGTMNEPSKGYFNTVNLNVLVTDLKKGPLPSPFESMILGAGFTREIGVFSPGFRGNVVNFPSSRIVINSQRVSAWLPGRECIWKQHGVWGINPAGVPVLLKANYFQTEKDFGRDFYLPFAQRYARAIREVNPNLLLFVELPPTDFGAVPFPAISVDELPGTVNASHWYDGMTLFRGTYSDKLGVDLKTKWPVFGKSNVRALFARQLAEIKHTTKEKMPESPTLVGEVGIPYNMNEGAAYRTGDFSTQVQAMNASIMAMEASMLSFTLWNYCASNNNKWGDGWNREDLSIFSRDQQTEDWKQNINSGGRAIAAFCRPYPMSVCGVVTFSAFDLSSRIFVLEFDEDISLNHLASEIYVPVGIHYPHGFRVLFTGGTYSYVDGGDKTSQILLCFCSQNEMSQLSRSKSSISRNSISSAAENKESDNCTSDIEEDLRVANSSHDSPLSNSSRQKISDSADDMKDRSSLRLSPHDNDTDEDQFARGARSPQSNSDVKSVNVNELSPVNIRTREHSRNDHEVKSRESSLLSVPRGENSRRKSRSPSSSMRRNLKHRLVIWPKEVPIQQPLPQADPEMRDMLLHAMLK